jgi:hypothetical protein
MLMKTGSDPRRDLPMLKGKFGRKGMTGGGIPSPEKTKRPERKKAFSLNSSSSIRP